MRFVSFFALLALGCGTGTTVPDAAAEAGPVARDGGRDASHPDGATADGGADARIDAGARADAGMDAGTHQDGGMDGGEVVPDATLEREWPLDTGAPTPADVAACHDSALELASRCSSPERECATLAYGEWCDTDDARALRVAFDCMIARSDASCRTLGDPSGSEACTDPGVEPFVDRARGRLAERVTAVCGFGVAGVDFLLYRTMAIGMYGPDRVLRATTCVDAAADCAAVEVCMRAEVADVFACYP